MKFKPSKKGVSDILPTGVGIAGGFLLSKGAMNIAPNAVKQPLVRSAIAAATLLAASAITGNDTTAKVVEGVLVGVSVQNIDGAVSEQVAKVTDSDDDSVKGKFMKGIAGLASPELDVNEDQYLIEDSQWNDYAPEASAKIFSKKKLASV